MRYLNKREDFLKQKKHIQGVPYETLLEEVTSSAGPFANDVGWNDSLLGRLINHAIRKARIAAKVPTIKRLIERLREEFEQIVRQSKVFSLAEEDQFIILKIQIQRLFEDLITAVEEGKSVNDLKKLTDVAITYVSNLKKFDKKDVLLVELKKFRDFLDQFKEGGEKEEEEKEVKPTNVNTQEIPFDFCVNNLQAVYAILLAYKNAMVVKGQAYMAKKDAKGDPIIVGKEYNYTNEKGKQSKVRVIDPKNQKGYGVDKKWITADDTNNGEMADTNVFVIDVTDGNIPDKGYAAIASKLGPISEAVATGTTPATGKPPIFNTIDPVFRYFMSDKGDVFKQLESIFKERDIAKRKLILQRYKSQLLKIYNTVRLNESLEEFLTRPEDIGKKLITMYKSTKVKEDGSFEGVQEDMKKAIAFFNKTMKAILQFQSGIGEKTKKEGEVETKPEETKPVEDQVKKEDDIDFDNKNRSQYEGKLLKYNSFIHINELMSGDIKSQSQKQSQEDSESSQPQVQSSTEQPGETTSDETIVYSVEKVKEFFNENCKEVIAFKVTTEEMVVSKRLEEAKNDKGIIMSMDPIIEIMKLFIKAYKTYTVLTITKRSENVDTNTLSEYTSFGASGGETGRSGPYRNNKLFDLWEDAVNDIRKDRKYQAIFTENANLRLPKVTDPDPTSPADWVIKPKAGTAFRQFINDVLDGDKLYKSGTDVGTISKFIEKYFGDGSVSENDVKGLQGADLTDAEKIATKIDENAIKLKLKESVVVPKANTFFTIRGMQPTTDPATFNKSIQRSFFVDKVDIGFVWLLCTVYLKRFSPLLDKLDKKHTFLDGDFTLTTDNTGDIEYTKISVTDFTKLKKDQVIKLATLDSRGNEKQKSIKIVSVYSLIKEIDNTVYTLSDEERTKFNTILKNGRLIDNISKDIVKDKLQTSSNTKITI